MKISYSSVESYCNDLHFYAQNMKDIIYSISSLSTNLSKNDSWSGSATEYYVKKLEKLTKSFDIVFQEIENSILYMANCSDGYQALDKKIIKEICDNLNIAEPTLLTSNIFNG